MLCIIFLCRLRRINTVGSFYLASQRVLANVFFFKSSLVFFIVLLITRYSLRLLPCISNLYNTFDSGVLDHHFFSFVPTQRWLEISIYIVDIKLLRTFYDRSLLREKCACHCPHYHRIRHFFPPLTLLR